MQNQVVFSCPSCGASLSARPDEVSVKCQFCGSTAMVPASRRASAPQPGPVYPPMAPGAATGANIYGLDPARVKAIGDAVRAGDKAEAARQYQALFGVGSTQAQQAVDTLASGQPVMVGTTAMGLPEYISVDAMVPAAPYVVPIMNAAPVMPMMSSMPMAYTTNNRVWRGIFGLNIAITVGVLLLTACITVAALLPFGLIAFPGILSGLGHFLGR